MLQFSFTSTIFLRQLLFGGKTDYCQYLNLYFCHESGGQEKSQAVSAASTSFTIQNLHESSAYKIQISPVVGSREGSPVLVTARTRGCIIITS